MKASKRFFHLINVIPAFPIKVHLAFATSPQPSTSRRFEKELFMYKVQ